jgi:chromosome segregation ATPase
MFDSIKERLTVKPESLTEEMKLINAYRSVFYSPEGRQVLTHLLVDLGVFNELEATEDEVGQHNAGIRILTRLGIIRANNMQNIVSTLLDLPVKLT